MTKSFHDPANPKPLWADIVAAVDGGVGAGVSAGEIEPVYGGDINQAFSFKRGWSRYFIKLNHRERRGMFEAEAAGLREISASNAIRCPQVIATGVSGDSAFLVLEFLELGRAGRADALGEALAALHRKRHPRFGWHRDNTLGATPQPNAFMDDWVGFLRERRLGHQLALAAGNGASRRLWEQGQELLSNLHRFFADYNPAASLLHGDLWGGNYGYLQDGEPVIYDPAVYYGDRESDLAMTELFGGFEAAFYDAYRANWPLDPGYGVRRTLYQLYHVLNHFNLFGGHYAARAEQMIEKLLVELQA